MKSIALLLLGLLCAEAAITLPASKITHRELPEDRKRQSGSNTEPVIEHLPSWIVNVELGSNKQSYSLIIDTGSGVLGVYGSPCYACSTNGPVYNPNRSSTSQLVRCNSQCTSCNSNNTCQTTVKYGDGSSWTGNIVNDQVTIADVTASANFAYMTTASSSFLKTWEQGILGLAYDGISYPTPVITNILKQNGLSNEFWLLFNRDGSGELTLGAPDNKYYKGILQSVPVYPTTTGNVYAFYRVQLGSFAVSGSPIATASDFSGLSIVDSGTTLILLPSTVYIAFVAALPAGLPCLSTFLQQRVCMMTAADIAQWPPISVTFSNGVEASMFPQDYIQYDFTQMGDRYYQLGVMSSGSSDCLLGDPFLSNRYTGFDRATNTIQFTENDATSMAASAFLIISLVLAAF